VRPPESQPESGCGEAQHEADGDVGEREQRSIRPQLDRSGHHRAVRREAAEHAGAEEHPQVGGLSQTGGEDADQQRPEHVDQQRGDREATGIRDRESERQPGRRADRTAGDDEELEYAALLGAARASLRLVDVDPGSHRRRVVLAADVPDAAVTPLDDPDTDRGAARAEVELTLAEIASAHIDVAEAEDDVRRAVGVVLEADLGSENAQFVVDQAEGHELAWYATQEIGPVLDLL